MTMFAVMRTGGKQYRVAEGDLIAVEKLGGEAGDSVSFDDVLIAGDGDKLEDLKNFTVSAEIVEQGRGEKVVVFKKKRRQNYRRKNGHRQYLTLLRITGLGSAKKAAPKKAAAKQDAEPAETEAKTAETAAPPAKKPAVKKAAPAKEAPAKKAAPAKKTAASETAGSDKPAKAETAAEKPVKKAPAKKAAATKTDDKDA